MTKFVIVAQVKEWYGNSEEPGQGPGRWKNKGGAEFVVELPYNHDEEEIKNAFNAKFDKETLYFRYEFISIDLADSRHEVKFIDGEFVTDREEIV